MTYTTTGSVEALLGFSFDGSTKPSLSEVGSVFLSMGDRKVDRISVPNATAGDKSDLSALWVSHLITIGKDVTTRTGDVNINPERIPSNFSMAFYDIVSDKDGVVGGKSYFKVANA